MKARQKSEDIVVPDGGRKVVESGGPFAPRGGKGVPVNQQDVQFQLPFATAENAADSSAATTNSTGAGLPAIPRREVPKAKDKENTAHPATMSRRPHRTATAVWRNVEVVNRPALRGAPAKRSVPKSRM